MSCNKYNRILQGETFNFIAVDNFERSVVLNTSVFFLTHYHSDHYEGLRKEHDAEEVGRIFSRNPEKLFYCSDITKRIFESDRGKTCFIPERQIISQPVGQPFNIFGPKREDGEHIVVTVTFIPSGHILGAVMILFEHDNERALFTGDFRIHPEDIKKVKALHDNDGDVKTIDHLYLDSTFASDEYPSFPLRSEVSKFVAEVVSDWLSLNSKNIVHLNLPYTFAYESLIIDISKHLKCKIMVTANTYEKYYRYIPELDAAVFPAPKYFDRNKFRIHACVSLSLARSKPQSCSLQRFSILKSCDFCPFKKQHVRLIRPSAQFFSSDKKDYRSLFQECDKSDIIRVPYSAHCSLEELKAFVTYIRPKEITTIGKNDSQFKNHILSIIETTKVTEADACNDKFPQNNHKLFSLTDSDGYNSDFDDCGLDSPPW